MLLAAASIRLSLAVVAVALAAGAGVGAGLLMRRVRPAPPAGGAAAAPAAPGPGNALQQQTRRILDGMAEGVVGLDARGRVTFSNPAATRILGWSPRDLLGSPFGHLVLGREEGSGAEDVAQTLQDGRSRDRSGVPFRRRDGSRFEGEFVVSSLREDGQVEGAVLVFRDLSEKAVAEERFRHLLEAAPDAMLVADHQGRILLVNRQAEALFGCRRDELVGQPVESLVPEALRDLRVRRREGDGAERRDGVRRELRGVRKDGTTFPVEVRLSPMPTAEGVQVMAVLRDVSGQRRLERHLNEAQALMGVGSWEWDVPADEVVWSEELHRLFGVPAGERIDLQGYLALIHPEDRAMTEKVVQQALQDHRDFSFVHRVQREDGTRAILSRGRVVVGDDGEVLRLQGSALDITGMAEGREVLQGKRRPGRWRNA